jgi:hypothetical protein
MARRQYDPSTDRQEIDALIRELSTTLQSFCEPTALVRGSLQRLRRRCGKKRCRCQRGQLHESVVFVDRSGGERKIRKANLGLERELRKPVRRYRNLRRLRARLGKLHAEILRCCDRLSEHRVAEGKRLLSRLRSTKVTTELFGHSRK